MKTQNFQCNESLQMWWGLGDGVVAAMGRQNCAHNRHGGFEQVTESEFGNYGHRKNGS